MMQSRSLRAAFLALIVFVVSTSATRSLSVTLTGPEAVNSVKHLRIIATVTNTGDETLKVLNDPRGPLNKLPTDTFVITDAKNTQPSFTGIKLKYVPKTAAALERYIILAPGESVVVEHDLGIAYNFTAAGPAIYDIHTRNPFYIVNPDSTISTLLASVHSHATKISGKLAVARPALVKRANYNGCSASQKTLISAAALVAQDYAAGALTYAKSLTSSTTRYTTWFGAYNTARHSTVVSHFSAINDNRFSSYTFDCSTCNEADTFAYVYPDDYGTIYLCDVFWQAPMMGENSKGGTLVHEASHFTKNGGTDDHAYGHTACQSLARNAPDTAVDNADSHEYFAENDPPLP
ncbi:hypothetical protein M413DRAFT_411996 [Hebeloma cylindrosporum]|uniref:Lysine-specific metallo-endopeptidase domain-containing protein n=1 Tax=Hebeloma cylindrosporum TaxID=76867 RepID=A0A0C2XTI8_HEBCY|nr:hypothetical protein M413DRAFT_411996 [Hebeloma cylindrosporum h7]